MQSNTLPINQWLNRQYSRLYSEIDSLEGKHPSGRDNAPWAAEIQGKLDACTMLKDTPVNQEKLKAVAQKFENSLPEGISKENMGMYRKGAQNFIVSCKEYLSSE